MSFLTDFTIKLPELKFAPKGDRIPTKEDTSMIW
jgi:hypothetical protein